MTTDDDKKKPDFSDVRALSVNDDGSINFHRGDLSDLAARDWVCPPEYLATLDRNWPAMLPLYLACYAIGQDLSLGMKKMCYDAYDDLVREAGGVPTTASLIDRCCLVAGVELIPMERLLHIRSIKEIMAIKISDAL